MNVWRLIAHHNEPEKAILWSQRRSQIAIGWGIIGDLRQSAPQDGTEIAAMIRQERPDLNNAHLGGPGLWRFYSEMAIGDLVILSDGKRRRAVMCVTGDYEWTDAPQPGLPGMYFHQRSVRRAEDDPNDLWERSGAGPARGESIRWTLVRCAKP